MGDRRAASLCPTAHSCAPSRRNDRRQWERRTHRHRVEPPRRGNLSGPARDNEQVTGPDALAVAAAGLAAGAINTIVGSGSLITFPTLLAVGYPPVVANVSNTIGLVPGSVSGAIGYREELRGQLRRILLLLPPAVLGAALGALL